MIRRAATSDHEERCAAAGDSWPLTHRVAVGAYLFCDGRVLLLKRINPPQTFAAVGGRLQSGEDPVAGLHREIAEETGLTARIHPETQTTGSLTTVNGWVAPVEGGKVGWPQLERPCVIRWVALVCPGLPV